MLWKKKQCWWLTDGFSYMPCTSSLRTMVQCSFHPPLHTRPLMTTRIPTASRMSKAGIRACNQQNKILYSAFYPSFHNCFLQFPFGRLLSAIHILQNTNTPVTRSTSVHVCGMCIIHVCCPHLCNVWWSATVMLNCVQDGRHLWLLKHERCRWCHFAENERWEGMVFWYAVCIDISVSKRQMILVDFFLLLL